MFRKNVGRILILTVVFLTTLGRCQAQTSKGEIVGTVSDEKGGVVVGAKVVLEDPAKGQKWETTTADNGVYRFLAVPSGKYNLRVEQSGFATLLVKEIVVAVDQTRSLDITLKVAAQAESVAVTGDADLAQTESSQVGQVIDNMKVVELPLNGRNFTQLARLTTGVATFGGGGGQQGGEGGVSGYSSNGQRSSSNNFMVDGIDNNDYFAGAVAQLPSVDSIQEFNVQTSTYDAEYGRYSGSVINLVTKSGTNDWHGSLFEFLRNSVFDARNFFVNESLEKPKLILNQFGGTFGGPIVKNRTFFFINYEGFRERAGITRITAVPTDDQRNGIFGSVTVPGNPVSAQVFALFPEPNLDPAQGLFISSPVLRNNTNQGLIKIDHRLSSGDSIAARYSRAGSEVFFPFTPGQSGTNIPGYGVMADGGSHLFSLGWTHAFSARMLNEARFGFTRSTLLNQTEAGPRAADFGFNTGHAANESFNLGNIPQIAFSGGFVTGATAISNLGGAIDQPNKTATNVFQVIDNFSYVTARHAWKFGYDFRRVQLNRFYDLAFSGQILFDGTLNPEGIANPLVDFAEGRPAGSLQFVGESGRGFRTTSYNFFAQDNFKINQNLTINFGLRYEVNTVLHEVNDKFSNFWPERFSTFLDPSASQTDIAALQAAGVVLQSDVGGVYDGDHNNFAPRIGLVYRIGKGNKTVVRAGYGLFYDTVLGNVPGNVMLNPPFLPNFFVPAPFTTWPDSFAPTGTGFPVLTIIDKGVRNPYAQQYNLGIQRELPGRMLLEVSYIGTTGTKLPRFRQMDQAFITQAQIDSLTPDVVTRMVLMGIPLPAAQFLATQIALIPSVARTPFFGFAQIFQAENSISSNYNSLQMKLDKRMSHGLTFLAAYTYSHSVDGASVFFGSGANGTTIFPQDNYNLKAEHGASDFDIRHRFSLSYVYEVPSWRRLFSSMPHVIADGWQLGGILTLQTGQPFSVLTGAGNSGTGLGNDRPNLIGDPFGGTCTNGVSTRSVDCWLNPAAFALNAPLTFGNSGRNAFRGPGFHNFDFSIVKNTKIGERLNTQFRAEFFNFTNHPNFALPNNVLSAPIFGQLFQTPDAAQNDTGLGSGGPRLIQFGLKFSF